MVRFYLVICSILAAATLAMGGSSPTVYLIRHGEKPADGGNGLSAQGLDRAQCLPSVFGKNSQYNIGKIMAQTPKSSMYYLFPFHLYLLPFNMFVCHDQ